MTRAGLLRVREAPSGTALDPAALGPGVGLIGFRALLLGGAAAGVGIVSHLAGDGLLPDWPTLLGLVAVAVGVASALVLSRASTCRIVLALVGGQALMHLALTGLAGHRAQTVEATGWWAHQLEHVGGQGITMLAAHTGGAVLLGLFLACAEESLWRVLVRGVLGRHLSLRCRQRLWLAALCGRLARIVVPSPAGPGAWRVAFIRTPARARSTIVHRGPPVVLAP